MNSKVKLALVLALVGCGGAKTQPPVADAPAGDPTAPAAVEAPAAAAPGADASAKPAAPAVPIGDAVKTYVTESTAAWASKDAKKFAALYAPDAVFATIGAKGWEEAKASDMEKFRGTYFASFPDLEMTYTRVVARGSFAVAEWVFTGTNKGDMMGKKATNKKAGFRGATVITFGPDGKVKRESNYFDMPTMLGQLGLGQKGQKVRPAEAKPTGAPEFLIGTDADKDDNARAWFTASSKDVNAVTALAAEDILVSNQYMPADSKGKKTLSKELTEGLKAFTDQKMAIVMCVPTAQVVACEYTWTATWSGAAMGMKPTGKTGTVHSLEVLTFKDGKVTGTRAYASGLEFASTFGLMDDKPKDGGSAPPAGSAPPVEPTKKK